MMSDCLLCVLCFVYDCFGFLGLGVGLWTVLGWEPLILDFVVMFGLGV